MKYKVSLEKGYAVISLTFDTLDQAKEIFFAMAVKAERGEGIRIFMEAVEDEQTTE